MTCEDCDKLWKAYEESVFEHVRLNNRQKLAHAAGDSDAIARINAEVTGALEKRAAAREALLVHERESGHGYRAD